MIEENQGHSIDMLEAASEIVAAYVANNSVPVTEIPALIINVHAALSGLMAGTGVAGSEAPTEKVELPSAAQVKKSIRPDGLVSFLDGKTYQTLKRHLTGQGLDPHEYRKRFGLPIDYPMVSASYSAKRSELAKSLGLGLPGRRKA